MANLSNAGEETLTPERVALTAAVEPLTRQVAALQRGLRLALAFSLVLTIFLVLVWIRVVPLPPPPSSPPSLFSAPEDLNSLIDEVRASTLTIHCGDSQGSGWVIDLKDFTFSRPRGVSVQTANAQASVITNDHVIAACRDQPDKLSVQVGGKKLKAMLYSWDTDSDLALLGVPAQIPALPLGRQPTPGHWVMALGTPYGLEGSVSYGNVINVDEGMVVTTAPLNSGNSGGPLVNSKGQVVGTSSWTLVDAEYGQQDWNVAISNRAVCLLVLDCSDAQEFAGSQ